MHLSPERFKSAETQICCRVLRLFRRHGLLNRETVRSWLNQKHSGFSLHADVRVHRDDRDALERLIRYCARPPFASEKLKWVKPGKLLSYTLPKASHTGRVNLLLDPIQFIDRLVALIPPPRVNQTHYHGAFAPNSPLRRAVTFFAAKAIPRLHSPWDELIAFLKEAAPVPSRNSYYPWADLVMRIYEDNPLECPKCGDTMRLIAFITDGYTIYRILTHLGLPANAPIIAEARETPQLEFWEQPKKEVYRQDIDLTVVMDGDPPHPDEYIDPPHPEDTNVYYAD